MRTRQRSRSRSSLLSRPYNPVRPAPANTSIAPRAPLQHLTDGKAINIALAVYAPTHKDGNRLGRRARRILAGLIAQ